MMGGGIAEVTQVLVVVAGGIAEMRGGVGGGCSGGERGSAQVVQEWWREALFRARLFLF